jgi:hypothetical protein
VAGQGITRPTLVDATGAAIPTPYIDSGGVVWNIYKAGSPDSDITGHVFHEGTTCSGTMWLAWTTPLCAYVCPSGISLDAATTAVHFIDNSPPQVDLGYRVATTSLVTSAPAGTYSRWRAADNCETVDASNLSAPFGWLGFLRASDTNQIQRPNVTFQQPAHWEMR